MTTLLHVQASPRQRSASTEVARAFLDAYRARHPAAAIQTLDLWSAELPAFDGVALDAKYAGIAGAERSPAEQAIWATITECARPLIEADVVVFSVPMWNFGIPYRLKHWIDLVSQKDLVFAFDEQGLRGLLGGKKALAICARGVSFEPGSPGESWDLQRGYLDVWFKMVGITDVHWLMVEKTLFGPEVDRVSRDAARREAETLAQQF